MVYDAVVAALGELGIPREEISHSARLQSDLELDSTETVEIALEMKRRFGVDVKLQSQRDLTVGDVCQLVEEQMAKTPSTS